MGRSSLTLAALASNAVDGLSITGARLHSWGGEGNYDSVVVTTDDARKLLFRVPTTRSAEEKATEELPALSAMSAGVRSRLPFGVPTLVGHCPVGPTTGRLYDYVPGGPLTSRDLKASGNLCASTGRAIAAIHALPPAVIDDFGLPRDSSATVASEIAVIVDRTRSTGRLPDVVAQRWDDALAWDPMWEFDGTVVHGDLSEASFGVSGSVVTGVFGWSKFRIGDPATDIAWCIDLPGIGFDITESYLASREGAVDAALRQRALLHRELDLARWLLHGVDTGSEAVVDDGARMLRALHADIERGAAAPLVPLPEPEPIEIVDDAAPDASPHPQQHLAYSPGTPVKPVSEVSVSDLPAAKTPTGAADASGPDMVSTPNSDNRGDEPQETAPLDLTPKAEMPNHTDERDND